MYPQTGQFAAGLGKIGDNNTKNSMARASVAYKLEDGTEAGDLIIENDRLKSTVGILNQKIKVQSDYEQVIAKKDREIDQLRDELRESEQARFGLKQDIEELNQKIVGFEEELYESKIIQLDLLDQLKLVDDQLEEAQEKNKELMKQNADLQAGQAVYIAHKYDKIDK